MGGAGTFLGISKGNLVAASLRISKGHLKRKPSDAKRLVCDDTPHPDSRGSGCQADPIENGRTWPHKAWSVAFSGNHKSPVYYKKIQ